MKLLFSEPKASQYLFAFYHLYNKEKLLMTNAAYNICFCYSSDKFKTIAFLYKQKTSFIPFRATQIVEFLLDN